MRVLRRQIPDRLFFAMMKLQAAGLGDNASEECPDAIFGQWRERLEALNLNFQGKHIVEFGSGRYARAALRWLAAGASQVTLLDLYAVPLDAEEHRLMLANDCSRLGLELDDVLERIKVIRGDLMTWPIPPAPQKADLLTSGAVLEHVQNPELALVKCREWLKPGGVTYHAIDLRDHYFDYPFEMLTFSVEVWERWLNPKGGFYLNRWRVPDYVQAMRQAGFVNISYDVFLQDEPGLREIRPRLNRQFQEISEKELSVLGIYLYGEAPAENSG
ncbi:MAG: methyltransferase domain-containing protein [Anaerolineae bacterium]|nr:methyltransferase domain-containing protein [Anaerolineae bacterium]